MSGHVATVLLLCGVVGACALSNPHGPRRATLEDVEDVAADRFGPDATVVLLPNVSATHVLVVYRSKETAQQPIAATSYFVYDRHDHRTVVHEEGLPGEVAWESDRFVRVHLTPGVVARDDAPEQTTSTYLIDVYSGERVDSDGS